jgi:hypothetical protein
MQEVIDQIIERAATWPEGQGRVWFVDVDPTGEPSGWRVDEPLPNTPYVREHG